MKSLTIIFLILIVTKANAQIPNSGFDNWRVVSNCIEPTSWYSFYSLVDSSGSYCPVTKSTEHYPENIGSYSVRISNDTAIWNTGIIPDSFLGWGMLLSTKLDDKPLFPVTGHPRLFCGYYKFLAENGDTMNINIHLYKNGVEITYGRFQSNVTTPDWTPFQIIFSDTSYYSVDSARVSFSAANEPKDGSRGPLGNSVLYIDNLSFDTLITSIPIYTNEISRTFCLNQNYPNPFNPVTKISWQVPVSSWQTLKVYDILGREVITLISGYKPAGRYEAELNTASISGGLQSGVYFYRLRAGGYTLVKKMILLR